MFIFNYYRWANLENEVSNSDCIHLLFLLLSFPLHFSSHFHSKELILASKDAQTYPIKSHKLVTGVPHVWP